MFIEGESRNNSRIHSGDKIGVIIGHQFGLQTHAT